MPTGLTREEINALEAGLELRALIAIHVFGWTLVDDYEVWQTHNSTGGHHEELWVDIDDMDDPGDYLQPWDTDHNAAMEVVDHALADMPSGKKYVGMEYDELEDAWAATFWTGSSGCMEGEAKTLPLAISKAGLLWALAKLEKENEHADK